MRGGAASASWEDHQPASTRKSQLLLHQGQGLKGPSRQSRGVSARGHAATRLNTRGPHTQRLQRAREGWWARPRGRRPSILRPHQAIRPGESKLRTTQKPACQVTNWKQPTRLPAAGEQASQAPPSRVMPRAPGTSPSRRCGWTSCPGAQAALVRCPVFRTLGRLHPHTQDPARSPELRAHPRGLLSPRRGPFRTQTTPWTLLHGPPSPSPSTTRGWAQAPLPGGHP